MTTQTMHWERKVLGAFSVLSGISLLAAPERMASVYGLPQRTWLARALGARDVLIGGELCMGSHAPGASLLRALSDTFDTGLIAVEALRQGRRARAAGLPVSSAVLLATYAHLLHARLRASAGARDFAGVPSDRRQAAAGSVK